MAFVHRSFVPVPQLKAFHKIQGRYGATCFKTPSLVC